MPHLWGGFTAGGQVSAGSVGQRCRDPLNLIVQVQLETSDSLDRVESWYQSKIKADKTIRLTSNSVVMKNQKVSITLAVENNKTNILIKQMP